MSPEIEVGRTVARISKNFSGLLQVVKFEVAFFPRSTLLLEDSTSNLSVSGTDKIIHAEQKVW